MKKKLFITMSAITALFFVGAITQVFGWSRSTFTTGGGGGPWHDQESSVIAVSTTVTANLRVCAPYTTVTNCGTRESLAIRINGDGTHTTMQTTTCTGTTGGVTPACAKNLTWTATAANNYLVKADQTSTGGATCGPTTGRIDANEPWNCPSN